MASPIRPGDGNEYRKLEESERVLRGVPTASVAPGFVACASRPAGVGYQWWWLTYLRTQRYREIFKHRSKQ